MTFQKLKCFLELGTFFILLPIVYYLDLIPGFWKIIPIIFFFAYCLYTLQKHKKLNKSDFNSIRGIETKYWLKLFIFPVLLILLLIIFYPSQVIADFSNKKILIAVICYPLFSSLPQEIIYRKFFFFRYKILFPNQNAAIFINAILFSVAHLYFQNWISLGLTFLGGLAFSLSYLKHKSLLYVTIEHSIYGLVLLSTYMNQFFYRPF